MRPRYIDDLGWAIAEVYDGVTDRILLNLARYFPYIRDGKEPRQLFEYQAKMLAQMGQINKDTVAIIADSLGGADAALQDALEKAIMDALRNEEPALQRAAKQGLTSRTPPEPELTPNQMQAFRSYYKQSADKLNLVNTVMLESTQAAYQATVSDIVNRIQLTQEFVNVAAGETITGASSWNQAMHDAVQKMCDNGLTGFIDHAGRHWSPEAYVAMDIRTTLHNTANAAVFERCEDYGVDTYQVSSHNGARPLCFPWQGKVISRGGGSAEVTDLDGNKIHVYAESETSRGQPAGLFGINCGHYPMAFIPGFSTLKGQPQDKDDNEKAYEQSQEQRALERDLRQERLKLAALKAQGATADEITAQQRKVDQASEAIQDFCDETGRARRRNREYTPVNASFPPEDSYDAQTFPTETRDRINEWFGNNGDDNPPPSPVNIHLGPDDMPPQGGAQIEAPGEQGKPLDRSLGEAYEYHRQTHNLNLVEYDPNSENQFITVDMNGMSEGARGTVESTLSELAQKYDTTLQTVRTMTPDEISEAGAGIACVRHDYRVDDSTMLINQSMCGDQDALNEIVRRNVEKGFFAPVPEDMYDRYVYTHEFGHTLINTSLRLDNKTNFAGVDYDGIKRIRREITDLYQEYTAEVAELERKARENSLLFEESFDPTLYYEGINLNKELKRITLSEYSLTNADEFFAESFVYTELGGTENPYAMRMRSIIDKYFRR